MKMYFQIIFVFLIINILSVLNVTSQNKGPTMVDSLINVSKKIKEDTNKVKIYYQIARTFIQNEYEFDKEFENSTFYEYANKGLNLSKKINFVRGIGDYYRVMGSFNWSIEKIKEAIENFETSINYSKYLDTISVARTYYQLGVLNSISANYTKSLEYLLNALKLYESINDTKGVGSCLSDIGSLYLYLSDYNESEKYLLKALEINEKNKDTFYLKLNYSNLGLVKDAKSEFKEGLKYQLKSLKLLGSDINKDHITSYINLGNSYLRLVDYKNAEMYYQMVIDSSKVYNCETCKVLGLSRFANLINSRIKNKIKDIDYKLDSIDIENLNKSIRYLNESLQIFQTNINFKEIITVKLLLSETYELKNDFSSAFTTFKEAVNLQDSISTIEVKTKIADLESKRALEIQEKENQILLKDNELINATLIQNKQQLTLAEKEKQLQHLAYLKEQAEKQEKEKQLTLSETQMKLQKSQIESLDKDKERQNAELKTKSLQRNFLIASAIVFIILFLIAFIRFREKKKLSEKLSLQNAEIERQKNLVETQKQFLEEKNHQIMSSISYAATIQNAILPWETSITNSFDEIFILFKPKDIVSGDSYWFQEVDGIKFLAVIDCTGHGVPGSMLTVIANSVLDDAVLSKKLTTTSEILTYMNGKVTEVLNQRLAENSIRDGMEVALLSIQKDRIQFSGAGRPLYLKNGTMEIIKTDKRGIAGHNDNDTYNYSSVEIKKSDNLILYLSSDGYADQMNENSKKYSTKRFVELLDKISSKPLSEQQVLLDNEFETHKGNREQIDDITIVGVRISKKGLNKSSPFLK
ncbi:hypothetical protein MASR1M45_16610 [Candidatus Kapaibacterium sp.]